MVKKNLFTAFSVLMVLSMLLAACATPTAQTIIQTQVVEKVVTQEVVQTQVVEVTKQVEVQVTPTPAPTNRKGGWLDEIDFSVVAKDSAITQIKAGAIDVYAGGLASADFPAIKDAGLSYGAYNGLYYDIMYNPAVFTDTKTLNPFSNRKIREATNYLYDRNYINQEVYAGGGLAKFFAIQTNGPDYADLADVARGLEAKYAYNLDKAKEIITTEMTAMGATLGADGKWQFGGAPVVLKFLIRPDSDGTRKPVGDYVANQLEAVGFTVDRQYKKSSEASPIWIGSNPVAGKWNLYTAAWSSTAISRDEKNMFQQMYLKTSVQGSHPFLDNTSDPAFQKLGDDLNNGNFTDLAQRRDMMAKAMAMGLEDSLQVWLIDGKNYAPFNAKVQVTTDLAAGVESAAVGPYTVRFVGQEGGTLKWGEPDLFAEPWNPIAGSNWAFDHAAYGMTSGQGFLSDPYTGLVWPLRAQKADITVDKSVIANKSLDWVTLSTADKVEVPADAWVDWDAAKQVFVTAGEKFTATQTAKYKSVVTYPADLYTTVKWHDGTPFSAADVVMGMIMTFDRAKKDSKIYDEQAVPNYESFISSFKGVKIVSTDPLVIETYSDLTQPDAENMATSWWPIYAYGEAPWHVLALANLAEEAGQLTYSADKADKLKVEQTNLIGGPSLEILNSKLISATAESYIPYAPTMGKYVTADEAKARYEALAPFYTHHLTFWVGTGPYILDRVYLTEKAATLKHFADYPDLANRWSNFGKPMLADATIEGDAQVKIGGEATFNVNVTFDGAPYKTADIKQVKYLLYNAKGEVVTVAAAEAVADGQYKIVLSKDVTAKLEAGSNKLEVAVIPIPVSVPTFTSIEFVTAP